MEPIDLQLTFFKYIKSVLPGNISIADDVAGLLNISNDSAYRRIRGEKPISFEEIRILCNHYHISLDQIININSNSTVFYGNKLDGNNFDCEKYLSGLITDMKLIAGAKEKNLIYETRDMPLFHYFLYPDAASFKLFFFMKTMLACPGMNKMHFEDHEIYDLIKKKSTDILKTYNQIPSIEIWSVDGLNATIRQIEYYSYSGVIKKKETVELLFDQLEHILEHIKEEAENGEKFLIGQKPQGIGNFHLYHNEWFLGNNSILVETDGTASIYINHGIINYIITRDKDFCNFTRSAMNNMMKKSLLISSVGEKERNRFFNVLKNRISKAKDDALNQKS